MTTDTTDYLNESMFAMDVEAIDPPTYTARVYRWTAKEALDHAVGSWLPVVAADFNRVMRPPRRDDDLAPTFEAAARAVDILARVMSADSRPPILVPRFDGGIQMEWHQDGVDLEIYIDADGSRSAWCTDRSGREWMAEGDELKEHVLKKELSLLTQ